MVDDTPVDLEHRFVATEATAPALARAFLLDAHRRPANWLLYLCVFILCALAVLAWTGRVAAMAVAIVPTLAVVGLLVAFAYRAALRQASRVVPAGGQLASGFGADAFVLEGPATARRIPYTAITSVRVHGPCVILGTSLPPLPPALLPRELFPDPALDRIRRGMNTRAADEPASGPDALDSTAVLPRDDSDVPIAMEHRFVADAGTVRRMVVANLAAPRARRSIILQMLVVLAVLFVVAYPSSGSDPVGALTGVVPLTAVYGVFVTALIWWRTSKNFRATAFEGAVQETGFGEAGYAARGPTGTRWVPYREVASITPRGQFVFIRKLDDPVTYIMPRALFPDAAIEQIRQARCEAGSTG